MRTRIITLILPIICLIIPSTYQQCLTENDADQRLSKTARSNLYNGQQAFTVSLLDAINKATPNENVFFSPYSTYHALLLAYFGARTTTEESLRKSLNLNWSENKNQVLQAYRFEIQMRAKRSINSTIEFSAADKIFVSKEAKLRDCMKSLFNDELETLDFATNPEQCRQDINHWVEKITHDQIKDILIPGTISSETKLVLANAAYFKGNWASKFNKTETKKEIFYSTPEKQSFVDMMYKKGQFNLALNERLGAHVLELPYEGENEDNNDVSMLIFLPPFVPNGLENVLSRLTPQTLQEALNEGFAREIEVKLPKFAFEKTIPFRPILEKVGVGNLFLDSSDLSGFSETVKLTLDDAIHKAKIEVDEEGSTAAAATILFSFRSARPAEPAQFFCDHPFLFLIYDKKSQAILFAGLYRGPEN